MAIFIEDLTQPGIEPESSASVEDALSTRPLISNQFAVQSNLYYTFPLLFGFSQIA